MVNFNGKILIIGCGAVAQSSIPLIFQNINIPAKNLILIDIVDKRDSIKNYIEQGIIFKNNKITKKNFKQVLGQYLKRGDICVDLANKVDTIEILNWCQENGILYLNTSLNSWHDTNSDPTTFDIYKTILNFVNKNDSSSTAILSHGANPGLISSFSKQAIIDMADSLLRKIKNKSLIKNFENYLQDNEFAQLSNLLNVKVIHISEIDSQRTSNSKKNNEFINTWSIVEFISECLQPAEFAWGTHENFVPTDAYVYDNNIFFDTRSCNLFLKSWVPNKQYIGIIPPHDETYTIADFLTLTENNKVIYRPTTIFVYKPCTQAVQSLVELKINNYKFPDYSKIIKQQISEGRERLGALIISDIFGSWWAGSILTIKQANEIASDQNATTMQVAAGVISALEYMIRNPEKGILFPEQLDHSQILQSAKSYLGDLVSKFSNFKPNQLNFENFLVYNLKK